MKALSLGLLLIFVTLNSFAQHAEIGICYSHIFMKGNIRTTHDLYNSPPITVLEEVDGFTQMFGLTGGFYHPLRINDDIALGLRGGLRLLFFPDDGDRNLGMEVPVTGLFRYGQGATFDSEMEIGFGIGGGIMIHRYSLEFPVSSEVNRYSPNLVAEITAMECVLRFYYSMSTLDTYYKNNSGNVPKLSHKMLGVDLAFMIQYH